MTQISSLSSANQKYIENLKNNSNNNQHVQKQNLESKSDTVELSIKKEQIKKSKKSLAFGMIAAAAIAILGSVYSLKKTGKIDKAGEIGKNVFKLADVNFDKGVAKLKDGSNFTGVIEDVLKNKDKITLQYVDGAIQYSSREGQKNFEKVFEVVNGEKIVTEIKDGVSKKTNITKIQNIVKDQKEKLKKLLEDKDLSLEDFQKQIDDIQYKSESDRLEIEKALKEKQDLKTKAQMQAEELARKIETDRLKYKSVDVLKPSEEKAVHFGMSLEEMVQEQGLDDLQKKTLSEAKNLTLDSDVNLFSDFRKADVFDVPEKMAIAADNSLRQKGNAYIYSSTPELFDGIEQDKIQQSITNFLDNVGSEKFSSFTIGDKVFKVERISGGEIGTVYKIFDDAGNSVAVKKYKDPLMMGVNCGFQEIATAQQATKENVVDIPKFFMANAAGYKTNPVDSHEYISQPMWMMSEFISDNTKAPSQGFKLADWMNQYGLYHGDLNSGAKKGDYVVDLGGVMPNRSGASIQNRKDWGRYFESALSKSLVFDGIQNTLRKLGL